MGGRYHINNHGRSLEILMTKLFSLVTVKLYNIIRFQHMTAVVIIITQNESLPFKI